MRMKVVTNRDPMIGYSRDRGYIGLPHCTSNASYTLSLPQPITLRQPVEGKNKTRSDTITKPVVYVDFRQTIGSFRQGLRLRRSAPLEEADIAKVEVTENA
jgi:hypothetical protein